LQPYYRTTVPDNSQNQTTHFSAAEIIARQSVEKFSNKPSISPISKWCITHAPTPWSNTEAAIHIKRPVIKNLVFFPITDATKIQNWIPKVTELTGKNIYLPCDAATDNLKIDVSWLRNWKPLDYSYGSRFQKSNLNGLWISEAEESDSGNYTCVVTTKVDSVNLTLFLIVHNETTIRFTNPDNLTGFEPFSLSVIWPMGVAIVCLLCVGILIIYCCYCRRKVKYLNFNWML